MMRILLLLLFITITQLTVLGQVIPKNGVKESAPELVFLKNAKIIVSPEKTISKGSLLIQGDKILKVGALLTAPKDAVVIDLDGKVICPAFIDLNSDFGVPKLKRSEGNNPYPQLETSKDGAYYWNESVHPEVNANELYKYDEKGAKAYVKNGFGFVMTRQNDGVIQGSGALVAVGNEEKSQFAKEHKSAFFSFRKGISRQTYPSSQMGCIALMRQAIYDAKWYAENKTELNLSLEALNKQLQFPQFFHTIEKYEILRAEKVAREHDLNFNYIGSGNEYEILPEIENLKGAIICPLNFPEAYDVSDPYVVRQIPLSDLKHWEMAPKNPALLEKSGLTICITSAGLEKPEQFWENLRTAISNGLTPEAALKALTINPAKTIHAEDEIGTLEPGKLASFGIYDRNPFEEKADILETWSIGKRAVHKELHKHEIAGKYHVHILNKKYPLDISPKGEKYSGKLTYTYIDPETSASKDSTTSVKVSLNENDITLQLNLDDDRYSGNVSLHGKVNSKLGVFEGSGFMPDGTWEKWSAIKNEKHDKKNDDDKTISLSSDTLVQTWFPNMAYGFDTFPKQQVIVFENVTIWTNEDQGVIPSGKVVIRDGKIAYVGDGRYTIPSGAIVIDGKGMHLTSGIIDEHSHIAISRGVNEGGQAISAEVSIGDVVNPDDINIYRQLSGGVTAAQLLHGSANPIGGQSALIKLKWGHSPDEMLIDDAPKFIKFALGENVKQSNWGNYNTVRFPQTRMGVEQIYVDAFERAIQYRKDWEDYDKDSTLTKPAVDLELETILEILDSKRFVSCHSYIQSEINMLMHVAEQFGFRINTFTHILEGYKVADKMHEHGAGGSTFSDWWAYKYEVNDAIPYNAKLMSDQGVVVAINSDDAEMGRRLNQEAAKAVKYGGMSEEEAWKTVTLNPAKLLHLDDRMGSIKEGKDADLVLWTDNPLSINAKVVTTLIDGMIMYDQKKDAELRKKNQAEKARIISKMTADNEAGKPKRRFLKRKRGAYHCNTLGEEMSTGENHH